MKMLSNDMRKRIVTLREEGHSSTDTANRLIVSRRSVQRIWKQYQDTGCYLHGKRGGGKPVKLKDHEASIRMWIKDEPGLTLEDLCERAKAEFGITMSVAGMWVYLNRIGLRFKKNDARKRARS